MGKTEILKVCSLLKFGFRRTKNTCNYALNKEVCLWLDPLLYCAEHSVCSENMYCVLWGRVLCLGLLSNHGWGDGGWFLSTCFKAQNILKFALLHTKEYSHTDNWNAHTHAHIQIHTNILTLVHKMYSPFHEYIQLSIHMHIHMLKPKTNMMGMYPVHINTPIMSVSHTNT